MRASEILDSVMVKNRVVDASTAIVFGDDAVATPFVFQPGEVKPMPKALAEWFVNHSHYKFNLDTGVRHSKLVILGRGKDESDLTARETFRDEMVAREEMQPTHFDPETGKPMRFAYINTNQVPGVLQAERQVNSAGAQAQEIAAKRAVATENRAEVVEKLVTEAAPVIDSLTPAQLAKAARDIAKVRGGDEA